MPHGTGTMIYADGDVYKGNFNQGILEGYGTMKYVDGEVYKGNF